MLLGEHVRILDQHYKILPIVAIAEHDERIFAVFNTMTESLPAADVLQRNSKDIRAIISRYSYPPTPC
jgi:hypothetical protein